MNVIASLLAQAASPTTSGGAPPGPVMQLFGSSMFPLILGIGLLYFFMFRSRTGDKKKREALINQLKKGDRVQTIGGILGSVLEARDNEVLLKVDETSNTKIRFARSAIHKVLSDEKTESDSK